MKAIFKLLLYFFCFFPFLFPINSLGTDVHFYAFVLAACYILSDLLRLRFSSEIRGFFLYTLLASIVALFSTVGAMTVMKCWFQYASLFVIGLAVYNLLIRTGGLDQRLCKIFILCWFAVGFVQTFFYPNFCTSIVANLRTTLDRGVCSLAAEPSFFGIQCFYFLFIANMFDRQKLFYSALIFVMALVFAQSFTGIIFCAVACLLFFLDNSTRKSFTFKKVLVLGVAFGIVSFGIKHYFKAERLETLVGLTASNQNLVEEDESAAVRFQAIEDALQTSYDAFFFPTGFSERVGSMFGGILQELGILGIPLMCLIAGVFASFFKKKWVRVIAFLAWCLLFFTNMQMANPTLVFVAALAIFRKNAIAFSPRLSATGIHCPE